MYNVSGENLTFIFKLESYTKSVTDGKDGDGAWKIKYIDVKYENGEEILINEKIIRAIDISDSVCEIILESGINYKVRSSASDIFDMFKLT